MDIQSLAEAYKSVYESQEDLQEYSAYLGGTIGKGQKSVTVGGSAGGFSTSATFGTQKGKDTDAATKASVTNAAADYQNQERSKEIASRNALTATAKPAASKPIPKGAKGAAALGGGLSLSSSEKAAADAKRAPLPAAAAKVAEPKERTVPFATANFSGSSRLGSSPTPTTSAKPKPAAPKPDPTKKPVGMGKRPSEMTGKPEMPKFYRKPEPPKDLGKGKGRDMISRGGMGEEFAYYQLLNYLIGEGYASTEEAADKIILNMSDNWYTSIMEEVGLGK